MGGGKRFEQGFAARRQSHRNPAAVARSRNAADQAKLLDPVALCGRNSNRSAPAHPHPPRVAAVLTDADFDAVLADYGEVLDIGRDDLKALYTELRGRAEEQRQALERV